VKNFPYSSGVVAAIEPGRKLGPYEIVAPLAAGGMGKLFKARDTRLDRTVAVKVLPEALVENPDVRERFQREARAISKVSHPRICALYDVGVEDGIDYLILEYIEGETLEQRLSRGPLPRELALEYGAQMAEGLDAAHRAGIAHRDLKPSNVMLTKAGVKVLDFGLAKRIDGALGSESADAPTEARDLTREHAIVGTLQYMAPEQLERKPVDARADLFALGAILCEMLTAEKAFRGESGASLIASILQSPPPALPDQPAALVRTIERCLAKDPGDRWQTAKDLGEELRWIAAVQEKSKPPTTRRPLWIAGALAGALAAGALVGMTWRREMQPAGLAARLSVTLPTGTVTPAGGVPFAISPDGRRLVFATAFGDRLQVRDIDNFQVRPLMGTELGRSPFFSPDGEWVAFLLIRGQMLKKVSLAGGVPQTICRVEGEPSGAWGPDGTIVFDSSSSGLFRVSSDGGEPEPLTTPDRARGEVSHRWPQFLPDGRVLFTAIAGEERHTAVVSLRTKETTILLEGVGGARYVPTGHLVYAQSGEIFALPFDLDEGADPGSPVRLESGISTSEVRGPLFAVSEAGFLAYVPGGADLGINEMVWVDRSGRATPLSEDEARYEYPQISPDGKRIAVALHSEAGNHDVWIFDVERRTRTRLTFEGDNSIPFWTADGTAVTFESSRADLLPRRILRQLVDGSGAPEALAFVLPGMNLGVWSPDGESFAFHSTGTGTGDDIWLARGEDEPRPVLHSSFNEMSPRFSPDGRFLAYVSDESGRNEIYVRPFPALDAKHLVSNGGGIGPVWSRDGREIFYRNEDGNRMMAASVETEGGFHPGTPQLLFEGSYERRYPGHPGFDVTADGRFVMVRSRRDTTEPNEIRIVLDWFEELRRRAPPDR